MNQKISFTFSNFQNKTTGYKHKFYWKYTILCISFGLKVTLVYTILKQYSTNATFQYNTTVYYYYTQLEINYKRVKIVIVLK